MLIVELHNPYQRLEYRFDIALARYTGNLENYVLEHIPVLGPYVDTLTGKTVTISPKNWGSIEIKEVQDDK